MLSCYQSVATEVVWERCKLMKTDTIIMVEIERAERGTTVPKMTARARSIKLFLLTLSLNLPTFPNLIKQVQSLRYISLINMYRKCFKLEGTEHCMT